MERARKLGIRQIELSSGLPLSASERQLLLSERSKGMNFLVHNYFPAPSEPFVLNLASLNSDLLRRSRDLCREAIELAAELEAPFYSVHAGFCFEAEPGDLGRMQGHLQREDRSQALEVFFESIQMLSQFGKEHGVELLVENNVVSRENAVDGEARYLGVRASELQSFVGKGDVGILLDTGHLKVTAKSLGFSSQHEVRALADSIRAVHISENDGISDTNCALPPQSTLPSELLDAGLGKRPWILEAYRLSDEQLLQQGALLSRFLRDEE